MHRPLPLPDEGVLEITSTVTALADCAPTATVLLPGDGLGPRICVTPHLRGSHVERRLDDVRERHPAVFLCASCALGSSSPPTDPPHRLLWVAGTLSRLRHQLARIEDEITDLDVFHNFIGIAEEVADPVVGHSGHLAQFLADPDEPGGPFATVGKDLRHRVAEFYTAWDSYRASEPISRRSGHALPARPRRLPFRGKAPAMVWVLATAGHPYPAPYAGETDHAAFAAWLFEASPLATTGQAAVFVTPRARIPRGHDPRFPLVVPVPAATTEDLMVALERWSGDPTAPFGELVAERMADRR